MVGKTARGRVIVVFRSVPRPRTMLIPAKVFICAAVNEVETRHPGVFATWNYCLRRAVIFSPPGNVCTGVVTLGADSLYVSENKPLLATRETDFSNPQLVITFLSEQDTEIPLQVETEVSPREELALTDRHHEQTKPSSLSSNFRSGSGRQSWPWACRPAGWRYSRRCNARP